MANDCDNFYNIYGKNAHKLFNEVFRQLCIDHPDFAKLKEMRTDFVRVYEYTKWRPELDKLHRLVRAYRVNIYGTYCIEMGEEGTGNYDFRAN